MHGIDYNRLECLVSQQIVFDINMKGLSLLKQCEKNSIKDLLLTEPLGLSVLFYFHPRANNNFEIAGLVPFNSRNHKFHFKTSIEKMYKN